MIWKQAKEIADKICSQLYPWTEQLFIGGSIRRQCPVVKDIEIICIPKRKVIVLGNGFSLFDAQPVQVIRKKPEAVKKFVDTVNQWPKIKGDPEKGRYTQRWIDNIIKLDLFMADENNIGLIHAIRTGSAEYSRRLMHHCKQRGYQVADGYLWEGASMVPVPDETKLFDLLKLKFVEPKYRNV